MYVHASLCIFLASAVACATTPLLLGFDAPHDAHAQTELEVRTVGVIGPYNMEPHGQYILDAVDLAVFDFNLDAEKRGWILETIKRDTKGDSDTTLAVVKELHNDYGIGVIIGPAYSSTLGHIKEYVNDGRIITVSYASGSTAHSTPDDFIFRTVADAATLVDAYVAHLQRDGIVNVITVSVDDSIGISVEEGIIDAVKNTGSITVLDSIRIPAKSDIADYGQFTRALNDSLSGVSLAEYATTAVVLFDHSGGIVDLVKDVASTLDSNDAGIGIGDTRWYGPDHSMSELEADPDAVAFLKKVQYKAIELAADENHINVCIDATLAADLATANTLAYQAYDAVFVVGGAIDAAKSATDTVSIKDHMIASSEKLDADRSAMGTSAAFNENGDLAASDYMIYGIDDDRNKFVPSARYDAESGLIVPRATYEGMRIGALVSETGALSDLGYSSAKSICLAVADYNAQLRADGADWQLDLAKLDDAAVPARSLEHTSAFYDDGIRSVLGPVTSASLANIKPFVDENDMLVISYASSSPTLKDETDKIFRLRASDDHAVSGYVKMLEYDGIKNVVVVHRDDEWGNALRDEVSAQLLEKDTQIALLSSEAYAADATSDQLGQVVDRVGNAIDSVDARTTAVMLFGFGELATLIDHAKDHYSLQDSLWYGATSTIVMEAGAVGQAWMERVRFLTLDPVYVENDVNRMIDLLVPNTNIYSYYAYDATYVLANAIRAAGSSVDTARLAPQIHAAASSISDPAVGFTIMLDDAGDLDGSDLVGLVFKDGSFKEYVYYDISQDALKPIPQNSRACR